MAAAISFCYSAHAEYTPSLLSATARMWLAKLAVSVPSVDFQKIEKGSFAMRQHCHNLPRALSFHLTVKSSILGEQSTLTVAVNRV